MEGQPHIVLNIDTSKGGNQEGIQFLLQDANGKHHSAIVKEHTARFSQILLEPTTIVHSKKSTC